MNEYIEMMEHTLSAWVKEYPVEWIEQAYKDTVGETTTKNDLAVDCISRADAIRGYCKGYAEALEEQEPILDKIRAEIDQYLEIEGFGSEYRNDVKGIIDKYKAETEIEDGQNTTIGEAIKVIRKMLAYTDLRARENLHADMVDACENAIDTMRKYQKIQEIVSDFIEYQKGISCGFGGATYMQMVSEVVEDEIS